MLGALHETDHVVDEEDVAVHGAAGALWADARKGPEHIGPAFMSMYSLKNTLPTQVDGYAVGREAECATLSEASEHCWLVSHQYSATNPTSS